MNYIENNHSIWFENPTTGGPSYNTYQTFDLISDGRPDVASPELKTTYIDIPGADGSLDYTETLNGRKYKNRTGSWEFYVLNDKYNSTLDWSDRWRSLMQKLHGKKFERIWLVDEGKYDNTIKEIKQLWYYTGRIYVNEWKSDPQFSKVVLDYDLEPYKRRDPDESANKDWLWSDLFSGDRVNPIKYGHFTVYDKKKRTIVNDTGGALEVTAECSSAMHVHIDITEDEQRSFPYPIDIDLRSDEDTTFQVPDGNVVVTFTGNGKVTLSYDGSTRSL